MQTPFAMQLEPQHSKQAWRLFWVVVLVAAVLRLAYLYMFQSSALFDIYFADQIYYREWAWRIASGDFLGKEIFDQGPLYAYLLAALLYFLGTETVRVLAVQFLIGLGTIALVFITTRRVADNLSAVVAGLVAATYGPFIFHEGLIMKTFLEPFLVAVIIYLCVRHKTDGQGRWLACAGIATGLACLIREVHVLFLPIIFFEALSRSDLIVSRKKSVFAAALGLFGFFSVIVPVTARNWLVSNELVPATAGGGEVLYIAFGPYAGPYYTPPPFIRTEPVLEHEDFRDEARLRTGRYLTRNESSHYWFSQAFSSIKSDPLRAGKLVLLRAMILYNNFEPPDSESYSVTSEMIPFLRALPSFGWVSGLGFLGILVSARHRERRVLLAALSAGLIGILVSYPFGRFRLALIPLWLIFSGIGASWIAKALTRSLRKTGAIALCMALLTWVSFLTPPASAFWVQATEEAFKQDLHQKQKHKEIMPQLIQSLREFPSNPYLYDALASQQDEIGKLFEAVILYQKALQIDKSMESTSWQLINVFFRQGNLDAALEQARLYVNLMPASSAGHIALAVFIAKRNMMHVGTEKQFHLDEAWEHFNEAINLDPESAAAYYYRGKYLCMSGNVLAGQQDIEMALNINPSFPNALHVNSILKDRIVKEHPAVVAP